MTFSGLEQRSPAALALPPCRRSSGTTARKTAPVRREARFLSSTSLQASRGRCCPSRSGAPCHVSTFFIYKKLRPPHAEAVMSHGRVRRQTRNTASGPLRRLRRRGGALLALPDQVGCMPAVGIGHRIELTTIRPELMNIKYSLILAFFHCQSNSQSQKKPLQTAFGAATVMSYVRDVLLSWCRSGHGRNH